MTSVIGSHLTQSAEPSLYLDGQLEVHRWRFAPDEAHVHDLAVAIGRAYVTPEARLSTPDAAVRSKVPTKDKVRSGDFGEMIAMGVHTARMGKIVPWSKLQRMKPVADATVHGADTVCLTITPGEAPEPLLIEAKLRSSGNPSGVLPAIADSVSVATDDYLVSVWATGAELMLAHPDHERDFAFAAAQHLGRLTDPDAPVRPHERHAVAVVGADKITEEKIKKYWPGVPPVSVLHVVEVPNLKTLRDELFDAAAALSYDDLTVGAASLVAPKSRPGLSGLISPEVPQRLADPEERDPLRIIVESSLWYLADEDGVALARARSAADRPDDEVKGLAQLLTGALGGAVGTLHGGPLEEFARAARDVVDLKKDPKALRSAAADLTVDVETEHAARHVAAALLHRLERHPTTMTAAKGATGPAVEHVVNQLRRFGKHAFWPSQAAAVRGGLLDPAQKSLAIKMPTSAGKTTLMELVIADTIDRSPQGMVAVLAPTRALVGQLYNDLRTGLPDDVAVRSSQGGLDYDTDLPSTAGVLSSGGVAVVTPERFDLDWRRATTGDGGLDLDNVQLLVVDEAQHVNNGPRGATLERVIAKALRRGIRVVLLASQFTDVDAIAKWIGGTALESDWRPAWLERHVFIRGLPDSSPTTARTGYLWPEGGDPVEVFTLKPSDKTKGDGWIRDRKHEAAGLVDKWEDEGLVVVFTANKSYAPKLLTTIMSEVSPSGDPPPALAELADSLEDLHPKEAKELRRGFGLHHADVPRAVRQAIESAARRQGGLLRCIVCTPTLLEGIDFPARTVVAAYPPRTASHKPDIARLRNLEGRAGRAGKFTSGRLVVMTSDHKQARTWRRAMRQELPPTETALTAALKVMQRRQPERMVGEAREIIDAFTIEVLAESAVADGDLRKALEDALQRTYWASTSPPQAKERAVASASNYARVTAGRVPDVELRNAFYRSGLKLNSCLALRDALNPKLGDIVSTLRDPFATAAQRDELLHELIALVVTALEELSDLQDVGDDGLRAVLTKWMQGIGEADIEQALPDEWQALTPNHLETMIPWGLTGAFEVIAALAGDLQLREAAHKQLAPARIRYGVPDQTLADVVREGADRVQVARIASEYEAGMADTWSVIQTLEKFVRDRLAEEAAAEVESSDEVEDA